MKTTYVDKKWDWMPDVKFIVMLRNPIERALEQYNRYSDNFPSSTSWNWSRPGESFADNIASDFEQTGAIVPNWNVLGEDYRGRFLLDGYYANVLKYFSDTMKLSDDTLLLVSYEKITKFDESEWSRIFNFLGVDSHDIKLSGECGESPEIKLDQKTHDIFRSFYEELNDELFEFIGYEMKELVV